MSFFINLAKHKISRHIKDGKQHNIVMSPLSLNANLNLVAAGARGQTFKQLLEFLESENIEAVHRKSSELIATVTQPSSYEDDVEDERPVLSFANSAWLHNGLCLNPVFEETARSIYKSETRLLDFSLVEDAVKKVNSWVEEKTKGLIDEILNPSTFDPTTILILINAIYFKGSWLLPFMESETVIDEFFLSPNYKTIEVPFMNTEDTEHYYGSFDGYEVLKLPYKCGKDEKRFAMYVYLPKEINEVQNLLNEVDFTQCLDLEKVELERMSLPKFKFSYRFVASKVMDQMGLTLPFESRGELTGMLAESSMSRGISISRIIHQAVIEVNEDGTEAAAVTWEDALGCSLENLTPPKPIFVADRPFMFVIKEDVSGNVLFIGAVFDPSSTESLDDDDDE